MVEKKWTCNDCKERECYIITVSKHDYDPFVNILLVEKNCLYGGTGNFKLNSEDVEAANNKPSKQKRSYKQYRLYYGGWLRLLCDEHGYTCSKDNIEMYHNYIKDQLLPDVFIERKLGGITFSEKQKKSIKKFDTIRMTEYMENAKKFIFEKWNINVPLPGDQGYDKLYEKYKDWM